MLEGLITKLKNVFSRKHPPKRYIIKGPDGRYRGEIKQNVYYTERYNMKGKTTFFYKFGGYSISLDTLNQLHDASVPLIRLLEHRDNVDRELWSVLPDWFEHGAAYTNKENDHQRILPMSYQYYTRTQAESRIKADVR